MLTPSGTRASERHCSSARGSRPSRRRRWCRLLLQPIPTFSTWSDHREREREREGGIERPRSRRDRRRAFRLSSNLPARPSSRLPNRKAMCNVGRIQKALHDSAAGEMAPAHTPLGGCTPPRQKRNL